MKQLTCEMCGSTDLLKQEGVFVCQTCGCKYSVEEAKKMMIEGTVEIQGTVKVDDSSKVENYLEMAWNAFDADNTAEADNYCNKIIEINHKNHKAWFLKGLAVGWSSSLDKPRIAETVNAFSNAIMFAPEETKAEFAEECKKALLKLHKAQISQRLKILEIHVSDREIAALLSDINLVKNNTVNRVGVIGRIYSVKHHVADRDLAR